MVEQGQQSFRLNKVGPTVHNEGTPLKFTDTTYNIESPDGRLAVKVRHSHEAGHYTVTWDNTSISPNKFFADAQALVQRIKEKGEVQPLEHKMFDGLDYALKDRQLVELDMGDFESVDELDHEDLVFARFNTPYGDFVCESPHEDRKITFLIGFVTHINLPDELTKFVLANSPAEIPADILREVLTTVGVQTSQRTAEKIATK